MRFRKLMPWLLAAACVSSFIFGSIGSGTGSGGANTAVAATPAPPDIRIYLDGRWIPSDVPAYIEPKTGFTMVPVRVVSQGIGANVDWAQKTQTVTVTRTGVKIVMQVGQKTASVNGEDTALDAPPVMKNNRVMVPIRFISEKLGLQVKWNPSTRWIQLLSKPGQEIKGAWVSTVYNLDWPSAASYGKIETQKQEYAAMLDELQGMGLNAVFVQVRPAADAFYPSKLVPWSKFLTGTQGQDPGYDPLAYMIEETHRRGMEFHAWFNPFRANTGSLTETMDPKHVSVQHPEWIVKAGAKMYINPGIPAARQHVIDTILEVVKGYSVDGVHLDDYFYPTDVAFDDSAAFQAYNAGGNADLADWRRGNINDFVLKLGKAIHAAKPGLPYGISPFGVWRNVEDDPTGSDTKAGVTTYDDMYADVRQWIRGGYLDYVMPQIYWSMSLTVARYDKLVDWWVHEVDGTRVKLYIGHAPYKLGTKETGWQTADELINQLKYNEKYPQVRGDVFFSAKDLRRNPLNPAAALRGYYGISAPAAGMVQ